MSEAIEVGDTVRLIGTYDHLDGDVVDLHAHSALVVWDEDEDGCEGWDDWSDLLDGEPQVEWHPLSLLVKSKRDDGPSKGARREAARVKHPGLLDEDGGYYL